MSIALTIKIPLNVTEILRDTSPENYEQTAIEFANDFIMTRVEEDILLKQLNVLAKQEITDVMRQRIMESYDGDLKMIRDALPNIEYKLEQK